jgi:hypothetical protein
MTNLPKIISSDECPAPRERGRARIKLNWKVKGCWATSQTQSCYTKSNLWLLALFQPPSQVTIATLNKWYSLLHPFSHVHFHNLWRNLIVIYLSPRHVIKTREVERKGIWKCLYWALLPQKCHLLNSHLT